ncbi:type III secretion system gatekeeper subunit SctW [Stenotrophomonas sp. NPDC077464]|uniref:type III secretion system gatekeeper subunit SctW n=1 Tax=unclassified Stenotrophomonas TaxID=196198 RepID=UPI0037D65AD0
MQDDVGALIASLQRRRDRQSSSGTGETQAWIDHVLDEQVDSKMSDLRALLDGLRSPVQLLGLLKQFFPDPSDMLAVLRALLTDEELQELRELLQAALEQLLAEQAAQGNAAAMRGGMNVAVKARLAASGNRFSARALRQSYRDFIGNPRDCVGEYAGWIATFGFDRRAQVVDFMEQALGADMYSLDPSASHLEFGQLLHQVRNLAVLRSADQLLVQEATRDGLLARLSTSAEAMVGGLLDVVRGLQDWAGLFAGPLADMRVALSAPERARVVQALRRAVGGLPDAVWSDELARERTADALEELVVESMKRERWRAGHAGGISV